MCSTLMARTQGHIVASVAIERYSGRILQALGGAPADGHNHRHKLLLKSELWLQQRL